MSGALDAIWPEGAALHRHTLGRWVPSRNECPLDPSGLSSHAAEAVFYAANDLVISNSDPRWPTHCDCGFQFAADDYRTHTSEPV